MPVALARRVQPRLIMAVDGVLLDAIPVGAGLVKATILVGDHLDQVDWSALSLTFRNELPSANQSLILGAQCGWWASLFVFLRRITRHGPDDLGIPYVASVNLPALPIVIPDFSPMVFHHPSTRNNWPQSVQISVPIVSHASGSWCMQ